jgi:hypothetical protein
VSLEAPGQHCATLRGLLMGGPAQQCGGLSMRRSAARSGAGSGPAAARPASLATENASGVGVLLVGLMSSASWSSVTTSRDAAMVPRLE